MKKILILIVAVLILSACAPVATAIPVPSELQGLIQKLLEVAVVFVVTQLAKQGLDFSGYKSQILAALFSASMIVIDMLLSKIPANLHEVVSAFLSFLVVVLSSFGVHAVYKAFKKN